MSQVEVNHERTELTFSLDGLSAREELLVKSFVRILSHRTLQSWAYCPSPFGQLDGFRADVQIISEDKLPSDVRSETIGQKSILVLGHVNRRLPGFLCLPLNAIELEGELNRLGQQILSVGKPPVLPSYAIQQTTGLNDTSEVAVIRLLRWPPTHLLNSKVRIKLATLMTGKAMTLLTLEKRSGQSEQVCREFLLDLQRAGLLSGLRQSPAPQPTTRPKNTPPSQLGLLARIRNRLGLGLQNRSNA